MSSLASFYNNLQNRSMGQNIMLIVGTICTFDIILHDDYQDSTGKIFMRQHKKNATSTKVFIGIFQTFKPASG
jgi:hypothetical protein